MGVEEITPTETENASASEFVEETAEITETTENVEEASSEDENAATTSEGEETPAQEQPPTPEEVAEWKRDAQRVKDFQASATKAQQEAATLRKEMEDFKRTNERPKTAAEYMSESFNDSQFLSSLRAKGVDPADLWNNYPHEFVKQREGWKSQQAEVYRTSEATQREQQETAAKVYTDFGDKYGDDFKAIAPKVNEYITGKYPQEYLSKMPPFEIPEFIEKAVRAVDPKLFERIDRQKAADKIKKINKEAAIEHAKGRPQTPSGSPTSKLSALKAKATETGHADDIQAYLEAKSEAAIRKG